ncbi:MAG: hypothetical protein WC934_02890 [Acidithiobacillus sp.]|jgi:polyhydroxyalkanoate synthesis regulator phasin|uniref:hypothetical protein n=1 Tax=Acidithiobacillus sp. TaxID=1872118 RepID=UPI00355DEE35
MSKRTQLEKDLRSLIKDQKLFSSGEQNVFKQTQLKKTNEKITTIKQQLCKISNYAKNHQYIDDCNENELING